MSKISHQSPEVSYSDFDSVDAYKEHRWYLIRTKAGKEEDALKNLNAFAELNNCKDCISETFIPYIFDHSDSSSKKKNLYPGHVLIKMKLNQDVWKSMSQSPNLGGFANTTKSSRLPMPLMEEEYQNMVNSVSKMHSKIKKVGLIRPGTSVQISAGFFSGMKGVVKTCNDQDKKATIVVDIFDKEHLIENINYSEFTIIDESDK